MPDISSDRLRFTLSESSSDAFLNLRRLLNLVMTLIRLACASQPFLTVAFLDILGACVGLLELDFSSPFRLVILATVTTDATSGGSDYKIGILG